MRILRFLRPACRQCGFPPQRGNPLVTVGAFRIHRSHVASMDPGFRRNGRLR